MDAAQLHLLLNHLPVIGGIFALALLAYGWIRGQDAVVRVALWALVVAGAAGIATYLSGEPAEEVVEELAGVSEALIERHEEAAAWATGGSVLAGLIALFVLGLHRARPVGRGAAAAVLVVGLGAAGLMGWTAHLGGQVRHSEIRSGFVAGETTAPGEREHDDDEDDEDEREAALPAVSVAG